MGVSVIIPAYNEKDIIQDTIHALSRVEDVCQIIVVDDGSSDGTAEKASAAGAQVFSLQKNRGKGYALTEGVFHATEEIIALIDADLGPSAREIVKLLEPVARGEADMAVALFPTATRKGGLGLVKTLAFWGVKALTGKSFRTALSGQRVLTREVLNKVTPFGAGYGAEVYSLIRCVRCGFRVVEVPVQMTHRETGRDLMGFYHRGRQFWQVLRALVYAGVSR